MNGLGDQLGNASQVMKHHISEQNKNDETPGLCKTTQQNNV